MEHIVQLNQRKNLNVQAALLVQVIQEILTLILLALLVMQDNILQLE
jgi:hypothetical protein